ncbi:hypothetical protein CABS01_06022 [Colletotrichum abscissum]|uniref:uncharacterized protein n=1 Tax=Colletotrichum abscissum TaxID=1671311 RepID=UPI0027D4CC97|nr:uncharacterized protein CABS01_06022 [Colletotrichum abscissum]KAK1518488.1 hypothetical protein CABS01_06022 [Colletotrichum abscissum]
MLHPALLIPLHQTDVHHLARIYCISTAPAIRLTGDQKSNPSYPPNNGTNPPTSSNRTRLLRSISRSPTTTSKAQQTRPRPLLQISTTRLLQQGSNHQETANPLAHPLDLLRHTLPPFSLPQLPKSSLVNQGSLLEAVFIERQFSNETTGCISWSACLRQRSDSVTPLPTCLFVAFDQETQTKSDTASGRRSEKGPRPRPRRATKTDT